MKNIFAHIALLSSIGLILSWGVNAETGYKEPTEGPRISSSRLCDKEFHIWKDLGENSSTAFRIQPYCATGDIQGRESFPGYDQLVIVQHGRNPKAEGYMDIIVDGAVSVGKLNETFVVSPHIISLSDWEKKMGGIPFDFDPDQHLYWDGIAWVVGSISSKSDNKLARSLFQIYNMMVIEALKRLPDVKEVVFVGQSAGGQYVHRYAAINTLALPQEISVRYVAANSQSYLYLDESRPYPVPFPGGINNGDDEPVLPTEGNCPTYDDYHVGISSFDPVSQEYIANIGANKIISQYKYRDVTYLVGEDDISNPEGTYSCRMQVQGKHRLQRATAYADYISNFYSPLAINHRLQVVPGYGHGGGILKEKCGIRWIFNEPAFCP